MRIDKKDLQRGVVCENEWLDQKEELQKNCDQNKALAFKKRKRMSMCGETSGGDIAWERRRQKTHRRRRNSNIHDCDDEDLDELRGCIELGFGFNEEDGQKLCNTLPALDLYFAINRHLSPASSPKQGPRRHRYATHNRATSLPVGSPTCGNVDPNSWKICKPGDDPAHVKMKLRHWAQVVACSVMQSY